MSERLVSRSAVVAAPPQEVFDLLADVHRHPEIDGSGTVQAVIDGPERLELGSRFGMRMRLGMPYTIHNEVVEFTDGRVIAWRHVNRHIWRYELEPDGAGCRVTETFDYRPARSPRALELMRFPDRNARGIEATLQRLQERFGAAG